MNYLSRVNIVNTKASVTYGGAEGGETLDG